MDRSEFFYKRNEWLHFRNDPDHVLDTKKNLKFLETSSGGGLHSMSAFKLLLMFYVPSIYTKFTLPQLVISDLFLTWFNRTK